jgi:rhamnulokinase
MTARVFGAVDIGASGGRVIAGLLDGSEVRLDPVHRFTNSCVESDGHLRWDLSALYRQVQHGLGVLTERYPQVESIGIDTWGVDYGLLDAHGQLLAQPVAYRDGRTDKAVEAVHRLVSFDELYAINGLQFLPFTTLYQLAAEQREQCWQHAAHVVLLPDLITFWLTGELRTEVTNASTTGLFDVRRKEWSSGLLDRLGIPARMLPPLEMPGSIRGHVDAPLRCSVTTVGSHDTASAVTAVPNRTDRFAYISCGTWSLVGVEVPSPILSAPARAANFSNEVGVDGRTRFLRNVGGLWLLQECIREWNNPELDALLDAAGRLEVGGPTVDVDATDFIAPGNMPQRIEQHLLKSGQEPPRTRAALVRCILDSLAAAYATTIDQATALSGRTVDTVHIIGGGAENQLLCQLTANHARLPVLAGPTEATALGNVLVQARAHGAAPATLETLRSIVPTRGLRRYHPQ